MQTQARPRPPPPRRQARPNLPIAASGSQSDPSEDKQMFASPKLTDANPLALRLNRPAEMNLDRDAAMSNITAAMQGPAFSSWNADVDLGLDLPPDLSLALQKRIKSQRRLRRHKENDENGNILDESDVGGSCSRSKRGEFSKLQTRSSSRRVLSNLSQSSTSSFGSSVGAKQSLLPARDIDASSDVESSTGSIADTDCFEYGELTRSQLQTRLRMATKVIKERERDLGIAAAVGKALLEKNMSLRDHFAERADQILGTADGREEHIDGNLPFTSPPRYSPPQSDAAPDTSLPRIEDEDEDEDETPRFQQTPFFASDSQDSLGSQSQRQQLDSFKTTPSSVQSDKMNGRSLLPSSSTRQQLDLISTQNDDLLQQLVQLQNENEEAKRKDGRRLRKLQREIESLNSELEAAESRNAQLEEDALARANARKERAARSRKNADGTPDRTMQWRTEVTASLARGEENHEALLDDIPQEFDQEQGSADYNCFRHKTFDDQRNAPEDERLLVEQLLRKVYELEEMNTALVQEAAERDGKIGRVLLDSERLQDLYHAVENEAKSATSDFGDKSPEHSPLQESPLSSPWKSLLRKRGAGNKHLIEGRRTLRSVLQSPKTRPPLSGTALASPFTQPRPRIFVTPSIEDLREKMLRDQEASSDVQASASVTSRKSCSPIDGLDTPDSILRARTIDGLPRSSANLRSLQSEMLAHEAGHNAIPEPPSSPTPPLQDQLNSTFGPSMMLRSTRSTSSLRSIAESDIADVWKAMPAAPKSEDPATSDHGKGSGSGSSSMQTQSRVFPVQALDGDWYAGLETRLVPLGALNDGQATCYETYERIESMTAQAPIMWADDDDFGKPITERHARRLGLLESQSIRKKMSAPNLLKWIGVGRKDKKGKGKAASTADLQTRQIQSSEQIADMKRNQDLLRRQRQTALQWRVSNGLLSAEAAKSRRAYEPLKLTWDGDEGTAFDDCDIEAEITKRAFAHRHVFRRSRSNKDADWQRSPHKQSNPEHRQRRPSQSRRLTLVERCHPAVVSERVHRFSAETLTWISSWAVLSIVMILAFVVTFTRGPRRVLQGRQD